VLDQLRYMRLARGVAEWLSIQCSKRRIDELMLAIETPILKRTNVTGYRKQVSTINTIELALAVEGVDWFIEINPTWAKRAATNDGSATKDEMVAASPFFGQAGDSVEAMADAWAIALAARLRVDQKLDLQALMRNEAYKVYTEEEL